VSNHKKERRNIVDKNDKAKNDKLSMKKKADKNNPKVKVQQLPGAAPVIVPKKVKVKKSY